MRLTLWQRLFLAFAALSGAALLGLVAWQQHSFRRGFLAYLDEAALVRLAPAATRLAAAYAEHGNNWDFLRDDPRRLGPLVEPRPPADNGEFADDRPLPPPPAERDDRSQPGEHAPPPDTRFPPDPRAAGAPPPRHGPPRGPPELLGRVLLLDAAGERIAGNPRVAADAPSLPVVLDGRRLGSLLLAPSPLLSGGADVAFAQAQFQSAGIAGVAILLAALLLAFALARWLLAPVAALAKGTQSLAAGEFSCRIGSTRRDELGELARDFDHLAAALEQARDARRQWGADIAHELRTPLSILRGEIQALQDGVRAYTPQALDSLHAECERLGSLVEDLYQLALADAGALDYRFAALDLGELVRECVELQRPPCRDAGLELDWIIPDAALLVHADARRIAQLLDNLLVNARRYTDAPGRIRVSVLASGAHVRAIVEDSAPGVPVAALPHLFDRLYRVDKARTRASGGAGLGLAICRAIVDAHGGHIEARASALGGLSVLVDLPAANP